MELIQFFIDLFLNLDVMLAEWVTAYGAWVYLMLFTIIFCETGLVFMAFLPGDSLLFTAGALAALSSESGEPVLDLGLLIGLLIVAAVLGDNTNYLIGRRFGDRMLASERLSRFIKPKYVEETQTFFAKHGGKTISLARFFPFIRTFAPFLAGVGGMDWLRFTGFNLAGGISWVLLFVLAGYFFGNIPVVAENLEFLVIGIIVVSVAPTAIHALRSRYRKTPDSPEAPEAPEAPEVP